MKNRTGDARKTGNAEKGLAWAAAEIGEDVVEVEGEGESVGGDEDEEVGFEWGVVDSGEADEEVGDHGDPEDMAEGDDFFESEYGVEGHHEHDGDHEGDEDDFGLDMLTE